MSDGEVWVREGTSFVQIETIGAEHNFSGAFDAVGIVYRREDVADEGAPDWQFVAHSIHAVPNPLNDEIVEIWQFGSADHVNMASMPTDAENSALFGRSWEVEKWNVGTSSWLPYHQFSTAPNNNSIDDYGGPGGSDLAAGDIIRARMRYVHGTLPPGAYTEWSDGFLLGEPE